MPKIEKDEFLELEEEFRTRIDGSNIDEINKIIAKVAKDEVDNKENQKNDQHLAERKAEAKEANAQYSEATKRHRLMIKYARKTVGAKGGE